MVSQPNVSAERRRFDPTLVERYKTGHPSPVAQGTFRRDLYFRLNVLSLRIPSLRERRQDIPLLAGHFLERLSRTSGQERSLSDDALKAMLAYDWPGNVRETRELPGASLCLHDRARNPPGRFA